MLPTWPQPRESEVSAKGIGEPPKSFPGVFQLAAESTWPALSNSPTYVPDKFRRRHMEVQCRLRASPQRSPGPYWPSLLFCPCQTQQAKTCLLHAYRLKQEYDEQVCSHMDLTLLVLWSFLEGRKAGWVCIQELDKPSGLHFST